ncbi:MAG: P-II family nitrogen regulator [Rikenellaceae bacterium]
MKRIEAVIRKTKFEEVREALLDAGIEWFTYSEVRGVGKSRQGRIYRGVIYDTSSIERILLTIVLSDESILPTVDAIVSAAHTGEIGDGRIFVSNVEEAYRIRLGNSSSQTQYIETRNR